MERVSVIINCLDGESFIAEAIQSVLNQTHKGLEIIVWDNQSTDKTAEIVKGIASEKIKYHYAPRKTHLGVARNLAVSKASFEWIAYLDCDDLWHERKLESQFNLLGKCGNAEEIGLIYGKMAICRMDGSRIPFKWDNLELPEGQIFNQLLEEDFIPLLSAIFRKKAFMKTGGIPSFYKVCEDYYLFLAISKKWETLALQEVCCTYRWHGANLSHRYRERTLWENKMIRLKWDPSYSCLNFISDSLSLVHRKIKRRLFPIEASIRRKRKGRSILIWGAGEKGKMCHKHLSKLNITIYGFVDKDLEKQNSSLFDKLVLSPDAIKKEDHLVIISSMYANEIEGSLTDMGLSSEKDFLHDNLN